jgi:hypothetical protein
LPALAGCPMTQRKELNGSHLQIVSLVPIFSQLDVEV